MRNLTVAAGLTFLAVVNSACSADTLSSRIITGRLIALDTKAPLANAYVTASWGIDSASVSGHGVFCVRSVAVQTDGNGNFRLPAWEKKGENAALFFADLDAYQPGYITASRDDGLHLTAAPRLFSRTLEMRPQDVVIEMKPFQGSEQERADQLDLFITRTICPNAQAMSLPDMMGMHRLYEAVYTEAKDLPARPPESPWMYGFQSRLLHLLEETKKRPKDDNSGDTAKP